MKSFEVSFGGETLNQPPSKSRVGARAVGREEERAEAGQRPEALELSQPLSRPEIGTPDHPFPSSPPGHSEGKAEPQHRARGGAAAPRPDTAAVPRCPGAPQKKKRCLELGGSSCKELT